MERTHALFRAISTEDLAKLSYCNLDQFEDLEMAMLMKYNLLEVPSHA